MATMFRQQQVYYCVRSLSGCVNSEHSLPCRAVCVCLYYYCKYVFFCIPSVYGYVLHRLGASAVFVSVCVYSPQLRQACVSSVVFCSIKQFRHLHRLLLSAEDPKKMPDCGAETQDITD